jgi:hypothetical protein
MFLTRKMNACFGQFCFGENALSATGGTWVSEVVSLAGLIDANGDGAQDHWLALPNGNADIVFNNGEELRLVAPAPGVGEVTTPTTPPYRVRPSNDALVTSTDPLLVTPGKPIKAGSTTAVTRLVDVDGDGRADVVSFTTPTTPSTAPTRLRLRGQHGDETRDPRPKHSSVRRF